MQREIAELERIIGDVKSFEVKKERLRAALDVLSDQPGRLQNALPQVNVLFDRKKPVYVSAELRFGEPSHVSGTLAKGVDAVALADRVKGIWEVARFENGAADLREILPRPKKTAPAQ